jgi:hypothetical protein
VNIGDSIACYMTKYIVVGWIVRTETAGRHRYWKVRVADADWAATVARDTAGADTATAVASIRSHAASAFGVSPGAVTEVVWESRPVTHTPGPSEFADQIGAGEKVLGEITFDIIVPEEGVAHVEGCYRINGGNWQVYYLTNQDKGAPWTGAPIVRSKAIFQSGISGVSGVVPGGWILNKRTIKKILAEAIGVDGWIEVSGPDSLILK